MNKKQFFKIFSLLSNLKILLAITLIITSSFKDSAVVKIIYPTTNFYRNNSEKRITKKSTQNSVEKTVRKFTIEKDITLPTFKIEMRDIEDFIKRNFLQRKYKKIILKFSLNDFADPGSMKLSIYPSINQKKHGVNKTRFDNSKIKVESNVKLKYENELNIGNNYIDLNKILKKDGKRLNIDYIIIEPSIKQIKINDQGVEKDEGYHLVFNIKAKIKSNLLNEIDLVELVQSNPSPPAPPSGE